MRKPKTGRSRRAEGCQRVVRKEAIYRDAPAPGTRPVAILLGQGPWLITACLPLNRALRHLALRCEIDGMRGEGDLHGGVDTPVAIAGGSPRGNTDEANVYFSGLSAMLRPLGDWPEVAIRATMRPAKVRWNIVCLLSLSDLDLQSGHLLLTKGVMILGSLTACVADFPAVSGCRVVLPEDGRKRSHGANVKKFRTLVAGPKFPTWKRWSRSRTRRAARFPASLRQPNRRVLILDSMRLTVRTDLLIYLCSL